MDGDLVDLAMREESFCSDPRASKVKKISASSLTKVLFQVWVFPPGKVKHLV